MTIRNSILLFLLLFLFACSKNDLTTDPNPTTKDTCRLLSADLFDGQNKIHGSATFTYNNDGYITASTSTQDSAFTTYSATYTNNKIVLKTKYYGDYVYILDDQRRAISFEENNLPYSHVLETYTYNSDGYLDRLTRTESYGITTYQLSYTNGNLVSAKGSTVPEPNSSYRDYVDVTFAYSEDKAVELLEPLNPLKALYVTKPLAGFFGKPSKNLLIKTSSFSYINPSYKFGSENTFSFEKDANNKITRINVRQLLTDNTIDATPYVRLDRSDYYLIRYSCN
ncbi:DUF4595 domain-containing protein [Pedobacter hiemivivus]|uniref:DUF4595 domain-containing protein n=1 Tax=Pedobacter hiemivivus TaxID=2530454 RepID=A0A4U1G6G3_9SPHI|nr:DUF4595 domain-containing protein [Pedobacter hiemivivus]TKC58143.1 DUF4595 domain-containing protein [Pedobacter hiemivivus]